MISFAWPWLLVLLPVPLLAGRLLPAVRQPAGSALRVPFYGDLAGDTSVASAVRRRRDGSSPVPDFETTLFGVQAPHRSMLPHVANVTCGRRVRQDAQSAGTGQLVGLMT